VWGLTAGTAKDKFNSSKVQTGLEICENNNSNTENKVKTGVILCESQSNFLLEAKA